MKGLKQIWFNKRNGFYLEFTNIGKKEKYASLAICLAPVSDLDSDEVRTVISVRLYGPWLLKEKKKKNQTKQTTLKTNQQAKPEKWIQEHKIMGFVGDWNSKSFVVVHDIKNTTNQIILCV